jgi:hypothetical protein
MPTYHMPNSGLAVSRQPRAGGRRSHCRAGQQANPVGTDQSFGRRMPVRRDVVKIADDFDGAWRFHGYTG